MEQSPYSEVRHLCGGETDAHSKNILLVAKSGREGTLIGRAFRSHFVDPKVDVLLYRSNLDQFPSVSSYDLVWVEGFQPVKNNPVGLLALKCEDQSKTFVSRFKPSSKFASHHKFLKNFNQTRHCWI